jgi:hypothetical protein
LTHCQHIMGDRPFVQHFRTPRCRMDQWIRWNPRRRALSVTIVQRCRRCGPPDIEQHHERTYAPIELGHALHRAGFLIRGVHDAVTLQPVGVYSPRIIVVAKRTAG